MPHSPATDSEGALHLGVRSNGQAIGEHITVVSVHVHRAVGGIPSARLVIADNAGRSDDTSVADEAGFEPGAQISITAGYGDDRGHTLFEGRVVRLGLQISSDNDRRVVVDCRHAAVAMTAQRKNIHHTGQPDSAVMRGLLQAHGLGAEVDDVPEACEPLTQHQCSDWDFLLARARAHGLLVVADDDRVRVRAADTAAGAVLKLTYGVDLIDFQAEVDARSALQTRQGLAPAQGRMRFQGSAKARVGTLIELEGVGQRMSGKVFVAAVAHEITDGRWLTTVEFGLPPDAQGTRGDAATARLPGLQVGIVTRLDDPDGAQRIQVRLPVLQVSEGAIDTVWARPMQFHASNGFGALFMPELGDEVVVAFFQHDPSQPVVLGGLYSHDRPPAHEAGAANDIKALVTRCGHRLVFDEQQRRITLTTPAGSQLVLGDAGHTVALKDAGGNRVELSPAGICIDTPKDLTIKAGGALRIEAGGALNVNALADLHCSGLNVACEAQVGFSGKGAASAELSAAGQTVVKGGMVLIN